MKKGFWLITLLVNITFAQNYFETGHIGIKSDNFGGLSIYSPHMITRQIDRISLLVSKDSMNVFDYMGDAGSVSQPNVVSSPEYGDYQLSVTIDNSYSNQQPSVQAEISAFGWTGSSFILLRFNVTSKETAPFNSYLGLEILPIINNSFGFEKVTLDHPQSIISINKKKFIGLRFLSNRVYSHKVIEWVAGYSKDKDFYQWLNSHKFDFTYNAGKDGSVIVTGIESILLQPNSTHSLWIAVASADTLTDLNKSIDSASQKIPQIVTDFEDKEIIVEEFGLKQNYPNPFNPATRIEFSLKEDCRVNLTVCDILGREVTTLIQGEYSKGAYSVDFNGSSLSSGIYIYRLTAGNLSFSKKMILLK